MKKTVFDFLRIAQIVIPGVAALYAALAKIWGWGFDTEIMASAAALVTFLGILLKIESVHYFKGKVIIETGEETND